MKSFLLKVLLFIVIFFIYDKLFFLISWLSPGTEADKRLENVINGEINKEIIILGSSRGARDLIANQIEQQTGYSTFNLCYPGSNIEFHEFLLRMLLRYNEHPKVIFFVVDDFSQLLRDETILFRLDRMYPLIKYPCIREELISRGEKKKYLSKLFILHQLNIRNFDLRKKHYTPLDTILPCGSMPISFQRGGRKWIYISDERRYPVDQEESHKLNAFQNAIDLCKNNNIKLVMVFPPNYQNPSRSFENRMRQLGGNTSGYLLYDTGNPIYLDKQFYYDESHLQRNSAEVFTNEVISYIENPEMKAYLRGSGSEQ